MFSVFNCLYIGFVSQLDSLWTKWIIMLNKDKHTPSYEHKRLPNHPKTQCTFFHFMLNIHKCVNIFFLLSATSIENFGAASYNATHFNEKQPHKKFSLIMFIKKIGGHQQATVLRLIYCHNWQSQSVVFLPRHN